jgi:DNA-directed RNA polymerase subunit RPC12/RpoP
MPLFEYECPKCATEITRLLVRPQEIKCSACGEIILAPKDFSTIQTITTETGTTISESEIDKRVAKDSEIVWESFEKRRQEALKVSKKENTNHLTMNVKGEFKKIDEKELNFRKEVKEAMVKGRSENGSKPITRKQNS